MCVTASLRTMGCGKSRHNSPDDSETDVKNSGSYNYSKNSSKNTTTTATTTTTSTGNKNAKKKTANSDDFNQTDKSGDKDAAERSPSFRKLTNGKTKIKDRDNEIGLPLSSSPGRGAGPSSNVPTEDSSDRSNGATKTQNKNYLLEVPNEITKPEPPARTAHKDLRTLTTSKAVHITTSQLEFFKMLDEKIEMGCDYQTSNEASEVSSLDETYKQ